MFKGIFDNTVYVRIYKNKFHLRHIESKKEAIVYAKDSVTTQRK